jgi:2-methylcitrate dehydratase PrpD
MLHSPAVTTILARFAVETRWEEVPAAARQQAKRALLNFFAVALAGCRSPPVEIARKSLQEFSRHNQATLIGRRDAAAANVLDFCDTHIATVIHPTAPVAPALFALSELRRVRRRVAAGVRSRRRDRMPHRPRHLSRPLRQGLAHHLDLRRVRRGNRRRQTHGPR